MQPQDPNSPNPSPNPPMPMGPQPGMSPAPAAQPLPLQPPMPPVQSAQPLLQAQPFQPTSPQPQAPPMPAFGQQPPMTPAPPAPPAPPVPPRGMSASPFVSPGTPPPAPTDHPFAPAPKKKKIMTLVILAVAALLVAGAIALVVTKLMGGIKLEQYSNDNLTMLVPVGYEKIEENGGASFEEKEGQDDTHSEVIAYYEALPSGLSESDLEQFRGTLRIAIEQAAERSASNSGQSIKNMKITDITFNGDKALKLIGDAMENDKKVGSYTMIAGINSKAVYMVGVGVHESDPGLGKKVDAIIDSFKLK